MSILSSMIKKKILIFGASGQIGRHLIRKLTKNYYKAICQTRNSHKSIFLKTLGSIGYIDIVESSIFDEKKITKLIEQSDICVNLIGILFEKDKINTFNRIHTDFPNFISKTCNEKKKILIHLSAIALSEKMNSKYAKSKINGENKIKENMINYAIIKPSIVFSVNDNFTTRFMSLLNILPFFPMYYSGKTKFSPIHASDLADLIYHIISKELYYKKEIEAVGPEVLDFNQIIKTLLKNINKKRILINMPTSLGKITAKILQIFPNPLLTIDQLELLKYDSIKTENGITNFDIGFKSSISFEEGIQKYAYNWRDGGQYSIKKYKNK